MCNFNIRKMNINDLDDVYSIEKNSFAIPWSKESFINDIKNNKCARYLVLEYEKKIIGYAGIWIILDEGHITNIALNKSFRSIGLGTKLFRELLSYSSNLGVKYITLEVRVSNIKAINLYKKFNFRKVNIRKNYYEDNKEDAFLMVSDNLPEPDPFFDENSYSYLFKLANNIV